MSTNRIYNTSTAKQTYSLGRKFASEVLTKHQRQSFVFGLRGDLGGGKTTFLQGFSEGLGIKEKVLSPTFAILKRYNNFYHFDCYRINHEKEILDLGFNEIISVSENIIAIEWAERIKNILPKNTFWIDFEFKDKNKRVVLFNKA